MRLANKVAIITGAGGGIGRATALRFAQEGAKVVVADYDVTGGQKTVGFIEEQGNEAIFVQVDVTSEQDCARLVIRTVECFGRLHILFSNAGIMTNADVVSESGEQWDRILAVNLKGVFLMAKNAVPEMIKAGGGAIVNMSSVTGFQGIPQLAAYSTAKAGVAGLTRQMAIDYAPVGIRVNAISPGTIDSPMLHRFLAETANPAAARQSFVEMHPLGRLGLPEDIANAVLFLASDEAAFITGHNLVVDGGYIIKGSQPRE